MVQLGDVVNSAPHTADEEDFGKAARFLAGGDARIRSSTDSGLQSQRSHHSATTDGVALEGGLAGRGDGVLRSPGAPGAESERAGEDTAWLEDQGAAHAEEEVQVDEGSEEMRMVSEEEMRKVAASLGY